MNLKEIRDLVELVTEKGLAEFELERSGVRIKISRRTAPSVPEPVFWQTPPAMGMPAPSAAPAAAPAPAAAAGAGSGARTTLPTPPPSMAPAGASSSATSEEVQTVKSPMVGTFYSAPALGTPPFVEVGVRVRVGQVLCIIEAMKLMNEIESEVEGEVLKCHVENGQPVEFGQPLFDIRPLASDRKR